MGDAGKDDLAKELATTPPVKQMDNLGAAVDEVEKEERSSGKDGADKPARTDKEADGKPTP